MVTRYGMSRLGARTFGHKEELVFLGKELHEERNYSDDTAKKIDEEVAKLVDDALEHSIKILTENRTVLKSLADALLERETLEKDEFDAVLAGKPLEKIETEPKRSEK
jgi:cell division protease FtsH